MLADALSSESYKFLRNRPVLFWGFLFAPLVGLVIGLGSELYFKRQLRDAGFLLATDVPRETLNGLVQAASPLTQLMCLIGAASLFAGEYRWETWRLITPRNSRLGLLAAKGLVYAAASAVTVLAIGAAAVISAVIGAAAHGATLRWATPAPGSYLVALAGAFVVPWLQLLQIGALAAAAAVATRSALPAVILPIILGAAQAILQGQLGVRALHPAFQDLLTLPGLAAEQLRAFLIAPAMGAASAVAPAVAVQALVGLAVWIGGAFALALAIFRRQDLARE